jgi:hypothetical protein
MRCGPPNPLHPLIVIVPIGSTPCGTVPSSAGEIEYRRGAFDAAFAHLRASVKLDDDLPYDEPWGWMQPTRHALGALLLEQVQWACGRAWLGTISFLCVVHA